MVKESSSQDRNFDDLAKRFKKNIYGGLKGDIRLAVLERDFTDHIPVVPFGAEVRPWRVLDAGGGQGQFSLQMARAGHQVVICDISAEMLKLAEEQVAAAGVQANVQLIHCAIQDLPAQLAPHEQQFDVVICHAVMEWMQEPFTLLPHLLHHLKPAGYLSLTFYNLHSLIYKNLLRTNFKKIINQDFGGSKGSLTPINPLNPQTVMEWIDALPLVVLEQSGIRVFHDYIFNEEHRAREPEQLLQMELHFSRQEPYRSLGRYIHVLARCIND
ncbi:methyltransferase domain-containing protein [Cellvibrio sp. PSBB023]|uniref:methyltransferase domain-containing protein n=1 Tax=Cellvibrio sp. PSBB023 TaxID=1945512 RepID=UPI00098EA9EB|nr:methyltransferase domain-containing protein [Cellvibrio sp. PSBB023]AQT59303.1 SAM-dependent methyltransferase [Cellvibrio sp. PSBB023]